MLGSLIKRKVDAEKFSNIFVNSMLEVTESGFRDLKDMIEHDPAFIAVPEISPKCADRFLLIITTGNLNLLVEHFEVHEANELRQLIIRKFANIYEMDAAEFNELIEETNSFISQVNHPSKNLLYGMSKAIFHQFNLNDYQEEYFRTMKTPNPLLLKRMDEVVNHFLWDWNQFFKRHRFNLN